MMPLFVKLLVLANALMLTWNLWTTAGRLPAYAQRPPVADEQGVPYLGVNINPSEVPPMVNINPYGRAPGVEVTRMPRLEVTASSCDSRQNFRTGIDSTVSGPLKLTYLNAPQDAQAALVDQQTGGQRPVDWNSSPLVGSAIYLSAGQLLQFDTEVMYSGCQPD